MTTTLGQFLRAHRKERGYSLQSVSREINIRVVQLEAIEMDQYHALPGPVYAVSFVKTYADFLKLDGAQLSADFKAHQEQYSAAFTMQSLDTGISQDIVSDNRVPPANVLTLSIVALILYVFVQNALIDQRAAERAKLMAIGPAPIVETAAENIVIPMIITKDGLIGPMHLGKSKDNRTKNALPLR